MTVYWIYQINYDGSLEPMLSVMFEEKDAQRQVIQYTSDLPKKHAQYRGYCYRPITV